MPPKYSIVIPAYNAERWLSSAIDSVFAQTASDWELVVVDDGSTDSTADLVARYESDRIRLISQANKGQSAAQNRGLEESRGEFVLLLDADDRLRPYSLSHLHGVLVAHPECSLAYGAGTYIREDGLPFRKDQRIRMSRKPSGDVLRAILKANFVGYVGAVLMRLESVRNAGYFRDDIVLAQDWEFWCRMATVGHFRYAGPRVVYEYRIHESSIARGTGSSVENQRAAIDAVFRNPAIRERFSPSTLRRLQRKRWSDAALFSAVELIRSGRTGTAREHLARALAGDPLSLRAGLLYVAMLLPSVPNSVMARLGASPAARENEAHCKEGTPR